MTHGKNNSPHSDERTTKYGSPRCNMIHHIPLSRAHDDSKRKGDIHIDVFTNQKTTNRRNREKWFKNCLDELGLLKVQKIAMPFKIGCCMDKGYWPNYLKMIIYYE
jgi:hypothetical protein